MSNRHLTNLSVEDSARQLDALQDDDDPVCVVPVERHESVYLEWDPPMSGGYTWPRILRPLERWWFDGKARRDFKRLPRVAKRLRRERQKLIR